jgi:putrescine transport system substrate-binding protein
MNCVPNLTDSTSEKRRIARLAAALVFSWLLGCGQHAEKTHATAEGEKLLNIYAWSDYIAPDTVANFEKETGIKVRYDTYDSNEMLETKLLTGHADYDIVIPTGTFFERQIHAGVYRKIDKTAVPNLVNADPDIMRRLAVHDPGNVYGIPYMWTTTGLGFNVDPIRARLGADLPDGWALLLDPKNAAKLADCGITLIDSPMDIFQSVIIYLGHDPNTLDPADVTAASEILRRIRPFIRNIDTAQYLNDLANGSICFVLGWSGDIERARNRAKEAGNGVHIAYLLPREGALLTVDVVGIPADAPHPHNAELWMNYLMRPDVTAGITNFINYPNGNLASLPLVEPVIRNDPSIYPSAATRARLVTPTAVSLEYSRIITREWTKFRTGY